MSDPWTSVLTGLGPDRVWNLDLDPGFAVRATKPKPEPVESDEDLRKRLLYVAGDSAAFIHEVSAAHGAQLDELAWRCGLKRRGTP